MFPSTRQTGLEPTAHRIPPSEQGSSQATCWQYAAGADIGKCLPFSNHWANSSQDPPFEQSGTTIEGQEGRHGTDSPGAIGTREVLIAMSKCLEEMARSFEPTTTPSHGPRETRHVKARWDRIRHSGPTGTGNGPHSSEREVQAPEDEARSPDRELTSPTPTAPQVLYPCPCRKNNPSGFTVRDHESCSRSAFKFASMAEPRYHTISQQGDRGSRYTCPRCKVGVDAEEALREHMMLPRQQMCEASFGYNEHGILPDESHETAQLATATSSEVLDPDLRQVVELLEIEELFDDAQELLKASLREKLRLLLPGAIDDDDYISFLAGQLELVFETHRVNITRQYLSRRWSSADAEAPLGNSNGTGEEQLPLRRATRRSRRSTLLQNLQRSAADTATAPAPTPTPTPTCKRTQKTAGARRASRPPSAELSQGFHATAPSRNCDRVEKNNPRIRQHTTHNDYPHVPAPGGAPPLPQATQSEPLPHDSSSPISSMSSNSSSSQEAATSNVLDDYDDGSSSDARPPSAATAHPRDLRDSGIGMMPCDTCGLEMCRCCADCPPSPTTGVQMPCPAAADHDRVSVVAAPPPPPLPPNKARSGGEHREDGSRDDDRGRGGRTEAPQASEQPEPGRMTGPGWRRQQQHRALQVAGQGRPSVGLGVWTGELGLLDGSQAAIRSGAWDEGSRGGEREGAAFSPRSFKQRVLRGQLLGL